MEHARALPRYLVTRYRGWRATSYADNKSWYQHLASEGQHPRAMVISCCDSRVSATDLFQADAGEVFLYRNIANLMPPKNDEGKYHGAPAAVEFAVTALKVAHLVIIGHSGCGGVKGCHDMCAGHAPEFEAPESLIGRWLELLRPAYERTADYADRAARLAAMEKEGVVLSLESLMTYPFVNDAVKADRLSLHGIWIDIASGTLEQYDPRRDGFVTI
jgi:carbonic anhydrase